VTDSAPPSPPLAAFRGPVVCHRTGNALILRGDAADCADEVLILTLIAPARADPPERLTAAVVTRLDEQRYRIAAQSGAWIVAATSCHLHRDIGGAFYRAIPARPAPLAKRLLWRLVMALAGSRAGKRLLLALRGR
jgi:hypothetical protein